MLKRITAALLAAALTALLCSCGDGGFHILGPKNFPVTVAGTEIKKAPKRVVCLSPSLTEIIFELGSYAQLCGTSDGCDYPEQAASLEKMGTAERPDTEKLINANPDLVITSGPLSQTLADALSLREIPVITVSGATDIDSLQETYISVGSALAGAETGKSNAEATYGRLIEKMRGISAGGEKGTAVFLPAEGVVAASGTFISDIMELAGFKNAAGTEPPADADWAEYVVSLNPGYIFCREDMAEEILQSTAFAGADAVLAGHVKGIPPELYERQGGRIFDAAKLMHDAPDSSGTASDAPVTPAGGSDSAQQ